MENEYKSKLMALCDGLGLDLNTVLENEPSEFFRIGECYLILLRGKSHYDQKESLHS